VVEEVRGRHRHVEIARFLDRLAAIHGLGHRELSRAILNEARDAIEIFPALGAGEPAPRTERFVRRLVSRVDVSLIRERDLGENSLGGWIDRVEVLARFGRDELAADEEVVPRFQFRIGGLGCRIVLPQIAENELRNRACRRRGARNSSRSCHFSSSRRPL
jgi:hypothetical protein